MRGRIFHDFLPLVTSTSVCLFRLKAEVERKDVEYEEALAVLQTRHNAEYKEVVEQLHDTEASRKALEAELTQARDKVRQTFDSHSLSTIICFSVPPMAWISGGIQMILDMPCLDMPCLAAIHVLKRTDAATYTG